MLVVGVLVAEGGRLYAARLRVRLFPALLLNMRHFNAVAPCKSTVSYLPFHFLAILLNLPSIGISLLAICTENPFMTQGLSLSRIEIFIQFQFLLKVHLTQTSI